MLQKCNFPDFKTLSQGQQAILMYFGRRKAGLKNSRELKGDPKNTKLS